MTKNERIISTMSLRERLRLLAGSEDLRGNPPENFEFPILTPSADPLFCAEVFATRFPCERALAASFNPTVIKAAFKCRGQEAKAAVPYAFYAVSDRPEASAVSSDAFVTAQYLSAKVRGLGYSGVYVQYESDPREDDAPAIKENVKLIADAVTRDNVLSARLLHKDYALPEDGGLLFGTAADKEQFVSCLEAGCVQVFIPDGIFDGIVEYVTELTEAYKKAQRLLAARKIDEVELERLKAARKVFDPDVVERACDKLIDAFIDMKRLHADAAQCKCTTADAAKPHEAVFDEKLHDRISLEAARQSVVLLKNDGVLPLKSGDKLAVVGEAAKNPDYAAWGNTSTVRALPFDAVNNYEIKTVGYAHGYLRGETGRADLQNTAGILCNDAAYALVWLCAEADACALPQGQLELVDALHRRGVKIIAIVEADGLIDMSFESKCAALFFAYRGGQRTPDAVYEMLTGAVDPSGRLPEPFPASLERDETGVLRGTGGVLHPFGFGLSYASFAYSNLKVTDAGVTCTVTNTGAHDGYETVFLYVQKTDGQGTVGRKLLRGFTKVFVKKGEAVKVHIPFDGGTFRIYDEKNAKFRVDGGKYAVFLAANAADVRLAGEITLAGYVYNEETVTTQKSVPTDVDAAYASFIKTEDAKEKRRAQQILPVWAKIAIALVSALYFVGLSVLCMAGTALDGLGVFKYVIFGAIALVAVIVAIVAAVRAVAAGRQKEEEPASWSTVIGSLDEFREIARVSYDEPVVEQNGENPEKTDGSASETLSEQDIDEPLAYDNASIDSGVQDIAFKDGVSFPELCNDFKRFCNARGVEIEMPSVRAIFAALAASRMVLMQVKNKEMLADFMDALSLYFNEAALMNAADDWSAPNDILWMRANGKYVASPLLDAVSLAVANPHKNGLAIVNNVNLNNLRSYFADFIRFALHPTEEHVLKVNDTSSITLPPNMHYILILQENAGEIPKWLANASVRIAPAVARTSITGTVGETLSVSRPTFDLLVRTACEEKYLDEAVWKKVDALCDAISKIEKMTLGNKNTLQLEKFTSVLLECGADENEALCGAFTAKLVPLLRTLELFGKEGGERAVFAVIEKMFPEEELSKVQRALLKQTAAQKEGAA